jgi:hypothetical protein
VQNLVIAVLPIPPYRDERLLAPSGGDIRDLAAPGANPSRFGIEAEDLVKPEKKIKANAGFISASVRAPGSCPRALQAHLRPEPRLRLGGKRAGWARPQPLDHPPVGPIHGPFGVGMRRYWRALIYRLVAFRRALADSTKSLPCAVSSPGHRRSHSVGSWCKSTPLLDVQTDRAPSHGRPWGRTVVAPSPRPPVKLRVYRLIPPPGLSMRLPPSISIL